MRRGGVGSTAFRGLQVARDFYTNTLGLKLTGGSVEEGWLEFSAGEDTTFGVFESDSKKSDDTGATFQVKDLGAEMTDLRRKGVVFEEYDLPGIKTVDGVATMGPEKVAWFKDPGGNVLCLHQAA